MCKHLIYSRRVAVAAILFLLPMALNARESDPLWVYSTPGGYFDSSPAIGDLDGDGVLDIVVTSTAGLVIVLDANGREIWRVDLGNPISVSPTLADITSTSDLEVVVLTESGRIVCLEGVTGNIIWEYVLPGEITRTRMGVVAADINGDGRTEIVTGDSDRTLVCLTGRGTDLWRYTSLEGLGSAPAVGDVDGDGVAEIIVTTESTPLICLTNEGNVRWRMQETEHREGCKREVSSPVIWDIDKDGRAEILIGLGNDLAMVSGAGEVLWKYGMEGQIDSAISVADTDDDGEVEIYAVDLSGNLASVTPKGKMRWTASVERRARRSPSVADVDGDGIVEILVAGYSGAIHIFDPAGVLEGRLTLPSGTNATATVADLLGDGGLWIVTPTVSGEVAAHRFKPATNSPAILWPEYRFSPSRTASLFPQVTRCIESGIANIDLGNFYANTAIFVLETVNAERRRFHVELEIKEDGRRIAYSQKRSSRKRLVSKLSYKPSEFSGKQLTFFCAVSDERQVIERHTYTINLVRFAEELEGLDAILAELAVLMPQLIDFRGMLERTHFLESKVMKLREPVEQAQSLLAMRRRTLRDELAALKSELSRMLTIIRSGVNAGRVLTVGSSNPWAPFGGMEEIIEGRACTDRTEVEVFRGETESTAINLFNLGGEPLTLRVELDDLTSADGASVLSWKNVFTLHEVVETATQRADKAADALPRLGQGQTLHVPPWSARQLWLTIDTSSLTPGSWATQVNLRSLDVIPHEETAEIAIEVWNTPLPKEQPLRLFHWTRTQRPEGTLEDQIAHGTNVFQGHTRPRATFNEAGEIVGKIDFRFHDAFITRHAPHGIILFRKRLLSLDGPAPQFSPPWRKAHTTAVRAWVEHLAEMGIGYDDFAFYPIDEPGIEDGKRVGLFLEWAEITHEADPSIRMYANPVVTVTLHDLQRMAPYVGIWCPFHIATFPKEKLDFIQSTNALKWTYTCADNAKHQSPLGYYRAQAWMAWHFGFTGIGYYTYFKGYKSWSLPASGFEYQMIYDGDGVVTSKRWEAVRDGVEDYKLLHELRTAANSAEARGIHADTVRQAQQVYGDEAARIARFCSWDEDGTEPSTGGLPEVRIVADKRWQRMRAARRKIAELLHILGEE